MFSFFGLWHVLEKSRPNPRGKRIWNKKRAKPAHNSTPSYGYSGNHFRNFFLSSGFIASTSKRPQLLLVYASGTPQ